MPSLVLTPCASARHVRTVISARNMGKMNLTAMKMLPTRYTKELQAGGSRVRRLQPPFIAHAMPRDEDFEEEEEEAEHEYEDSYDFELEPDSSMRLYLDSADVKAWQQWAEAGLFYGFTTNPSILKRDGVPCTIPSMRHLAREAFSLPGVQELQLQAWGRTSAQLYSRGLELYELDERVVVKVALTMEGLRAAHLLASDGVPVTLTGLYSAHQIVTALAAGVNYAAPYLGRMNDAGKNGQEIISQMQSILDMSTTVEGEARLLVASIRNADELAALAAEGCNTFTISPAVAGELMADPLTLEAAEVFEEHADEMGGLKGQ